MKIVKPTSVRSAVIREEQLCEDVRSDGTGWRRTGAQVTAKRCRQWRAVPEEVSVVGRWRGENNIFDLIQAFRITPDTVFYKSIFSKRHSYSFTDSTMLKT